MSRVFEIGDIVSIGENDADAPLYRILALHPQYRGVRVPKSVEYLNNDGALNPIIEESTHKQWANIDFRLVSGNTDSSSRKRKRTLLPLEIQILKQERKFINTEFHLKTIRNVLGFSNVIIASAPPPNSKEWKNRLYNIHVQVSKTKLTHGVL